MSSVLKSGAELKRIIGLASKTGVHIQWHLGTRGLTLLEGSIKGFKGFNLGKQFVEAMSNGYDLFSQGFNLLALLGVFSAKLGVGVGVSGAGGLTGWGGGYHAWYIHFPSLRNWTRRVRRVMVSFITFVDLNGINQRAS